MSAIEFTKRDPRFDIPAGVYETRFAGYEEVAADDLAGAENSQYATGGARYRFSWEILSGEHRGKTIQQLCGVSATPKSRLRAILNGLAGGEAEDAVDPDNYVDRFFKVGLKVNPASPAGNCHVESLYPIDQPKSAESFPFGANGGADKPAAKASGKPAAKLYWCSANGAKAEIITEHKVQALVNKLGAGKVRLQEATPNGARIGKERTAKEFGFVKD
jgi:hypothetical protein